MYRPDSICGGSVEALESCCRGEETQEVPAFRESSRILNGCLQVVVSFALSEEGQDATYDFLLGCKQTLPGQTPIRVWEPTVQARPDELIPEDYKAYAVYAYGVDNPTAGYLVSNGARERERLQIESTRQLAEVIELPMHIVQVTEESHAVQVIAGS